MAEVRIRKEVYVTPRDLTSFIVSLGGVKFWAVAIFPTYVGWVLGQSPPRSLFIDDLAIVLALVVIGPLLGTFTLLLNTYYDMGTTDRVNPRKQYVSAIEDILDRDTIRYAAWGFAGIGLLVAWFIASYLIDYGGSAGGAATRLLGPQVFFVLMLLAAVLSVAYSHPRSRWKGVPGLDLVTNVVGFGVLSPLAGWALLRPVEEFPVWYLVSVALFVGAAYAPTTASDFESDRTYGIRTMAVALGVRGAMLVGFALLVGAVAVLAGGGLGRWFPFTGSAVDAFDVLAPFLAAQIALYAAFLRKPTQPKIWALLLLLSVLQAISTLLFLYFFVGGQAYGR